MSPTYDIQVSLTQINSSVGITGISATNTSIISTVLLGGKQGEPGAPGANGIGIPTGGTAGQVLTKLDGTNYNTQWVTGGTGTVTSVTSADANATIITTTTTPVITIVSAPKLATARTINGVSFDGTANITITDSTKEPAITIGTSAQYWRGDKTMQTLNQDAVPSGTTNKAYTATEQTKLAAITGTNTGDQTTISGNAGTATTLQTARTIGTLTGDVTSAGSSFNGSANNTNATVVVKINGVALSGLATGILKNTTTTGVPSIAVAGTDYEVPLTFSTGLTRTTNTITVNTSQNIATLSNLTSNGSVMTTGGTGTLTVVTNTGSGNNVLATSPTLVTPALGTPSALVLTNATGLVASTGTTATGTPSSTTFLRGDNTWATPAGSGTVTSVTSADANATVATTTTTPVITIVAAPKLTTARTIAGVSFDGTANIAIASTGLSNTANIALDTNTLTFTNKRVTLRVITATSSSTPTPTGDTADIWFLSTLTVGATFAAPTGTPTDGQKLKVRVKSVAAQTLAWNAIYISSGVATLPTTSIAGKTITMQFEYDLAMTKWVLMAVDTTGY